MNDIVFGILHLVLEPSASDSLSLITSRHKMT